MDWSSEYGRRYYFSFVAKLPTQNHHLQTGTVCIYGTNGMQSFIYMGFTYNV